MLDEDVLECEVGLLSLRYAALAHALIVLCSASTVSEPPMRRQDGNQR